MKRIFINNKNITDKKALYTFCAILAVFFPFFGLAGAIWILYSARSGARTEQDLYEEYEAYIEQKSSAPVDRALFTELTRRMQREVGFLPFVEIIRGSEVKAKERAIKKLSKIMSRSSVSLLKEALKDKSSEIRFYSAGALIKIEEELSKKVQAESEKAKERGAAGDYAYLGNLYKLYNDTGLVDGDLSRHYLGLACKAYRMSLDRDTDQPDVFIAYAKCLIALGQYSEAKALLDKGVKIWPEDQYIRISRADVYFKLGDYRAVIDGIKDMDMNRLSPEEKEVVQLWK